MKGRYKVAFYIVLLLFVFTGCKNPKTGVKDESYFPLAVGNYWKYKITHNNTMTIVKITDTIIVNDTLFYKVVQSSSDVSNVEIFYFSEDSSGNILIKDDSISAPERLYWKEIVPDTSFNYVIYDRLIGDSVCISFVAKDTVKIPAGVFPCIKLYEEPLRQKGFDYYFYEWYAKGVGLIKQVSSPIKGNLHLEEVLIEARVNGIKYP